jgi:putative oxidoreductase
MKPLARHQDLVYAVLRIVAGFLFLQHGLQKCFGLLGGKVATAPLMIAAGWIELVAGTLISLGLFTPYAAFLASGMMAVAYFKAHAPNGFWPVVNRGELAALYSFLFLYLAARGSGILSIDRLRGKK